MISEELPVSVTRPLRYLFRSATAAAETSERETRLWTYLFCLTVIFLSGVNESFAQRNRPAAKQIFRENVTLPLDNNLLKRFGTVEELLVNQRWAEAIGTLQEIAQTEGRSLVLVRPGKVGGTATYLNAATWCSVLLSRVPAEGRAVYRQKVDAQSKRWFENWQRTGDTDELTKIIRQMFLSSHGDDALLALGEVAWDRGDFSAARQYWEQLIPLREGADPADYPTVRRYPDSQIDQGQILARLVMCSILERDQARAESELLQFAELNSDAVGTLGGQTGKLVDLLRQMLDQSTQWTIKSRENQISTFGLSSERYRPISQSVDIGAVRWVHHFPPNPFSSQIGALPFQSELLSYHPVVHESRFDKLMFVNDADKIQAWNLVTGEPAWQSEGRDPTVVYPIVPDESTLPPDKTHCVGAPHYTMTIAQDHLFARMGSPITCSSTSELRRDSPSNLVCLDLLQEGKLIWKVGSQELFGEDQSWRFEGTPMVTAGRAYVVSSRRHPQLEMLIACLDAADGRLLWKTPIGSFRASIEEGENRISHLLLTSGGGRVFLSTDAGAVVALDASDGRLEWAISYESRPPSKAAQIDLSQQSLRPPLFHAGLLFVAPADSNSAFCMEADSGRMRWIFPYLQNSPVEIPETERQENDSEKLRKMEWRHLLGVVPGGREGRLIVSGGSLWWIDIETGRIAFSRNDGISGRGKMAFGRGMITDEVVLFPTRDSIEIFQSATGEPVRSVQLKTPDSDQHGGNLTIAAGMVIVAQPNRLVAYGEFSKIKEQLEKDLTSRETDEQLQFQLAEMEVIDDQLDSAVTRFQGIMSHLDPEDPGKRMVAQRLARRLREAGLADIRQSKLTEAQARLETALSLADDVKDRVDILWNLARLHETISQPEKAIQTLQTILSDASLSEWSRGISTTGLAATHEISRLIREHGRGAYREIESKAADKFREMQQNGNIAALKQLIAEFPHSETIIDSQLRLIQLYRQSGDTLGACDVFHRMRSADDPEDLRIEKTLSLLEILESIPATNLAEPLWMELAATQKSSEVTYLGKSSDLLELSRLRIQTIRDTSRTDSTFVERTWSRHLSNGGRTIIPEREPPSDRLEVVLVCQPNPVNPSAWTWECLNLATGECQWKRNESRPIELAVWSPFRLMIATSAGWQSCNAISGQPDWVQTFSSESQPRFFTEARGDLGGIVWPACFDVKNGLCLYDPENGQIVATIRPRGRLHSVVGFGNFTTSLHRLREDEFNQSPATTSDGSPDSLNNSIGFLLQTVNPVQTWFALATSPRDNWSIEEITYSQQLWNDTPFVLKNQFHGITTENHLIAFQPPGTANQNDDQIDSHSSTPEQMTWSADNLAFGLRNPIALTISDQLLLIVNGIQLASYDSLTGQRKWSTGLADFPLNDPKNQIGVFGDRVFATSQGQFRSISTRDGSILSEHYLGSTTPQWQTKALFAGGSIRNDRSRSLDPVKVPTLIATWPILDHHRGIYPIWFCDSESGRIIQIFRLDEKPTSISLNRSGHGLACTDHSVNGLKFVSQSPPISRNN